MEKKVLQAKAAIQIQAAAAEVFEAIVDPNIMKQYFISFGSGRMEEGRELIWRFPEFDSDALIKVGRVVPGAFVSFLWEGSQGNELKVEIHLEPMDDGSTVVRVTEGFMVNNDDGLRWLVGNTEGWANFLACMKAWLEYKIHLRKGAFDFMRD